VQSTTAGVHIREQLRCIKLLEIRSGFKVDCWFRFALDLDLLFVLCYFVPVLSAFVVGLVS